VTAVLDFAHPDQKPKYFGRLRGEVLRGQSTLLGSTWERNAVSFGVPSSSSMSLQKS
jgi:hypothetical protein